MLSLDSFSVKRAPKFKNIDKVPRISVRILFPEIALPEVPGFWPMAYLFYQYN